MASTNIGEPTAASWDDGATNRTLKHVDTRVDQATYKANRALRARITNRPCKYSARTTHETAIRLTRLVPPLQHVTIRFNNRSTTTATTPLNALVEHQRYSTTVDTNRERIYCYYCGYDFHWGPGCEHMLREWHHHPTLLTCQNARQPIDVIGAPETAKDRDLAQTSVTIDNPDARFDSRASRRAEHVNKSQQQSTPDLYDDDLVDTAIRYADRCQQQDDSLAQKTANGNGMCV